MKIYVRNVVPHSEVVVNLSLIVVPHTEVVVHKMAMDVVSHTEVFVLYVVVVVILKIHGIKEIVVVD